MTIAHSFGSARDFGLNGTAKAFPIVSCHGLLLPALTRMMPRYVQADERSCFDFAKRRLLRSKLHSEPYHYSALACREAPQRQGSDAQNARQAEPTCEPALMTAAAFPPAR